MNRISVRPSSFYTVLAVSTVALLTWSFSGCMSMQGQGTMDAIQSSLPNAPVVEAFIEYPGPAERWAGPRSFLLHISARDGQSAVIEVMPKTFEQTEPEVKDRKVASSGGDARTGITADLARDYLGQFSQVVNETQPEFSGCLYPIRVRLVRANGALVEKQGCRGYGRLASGASDFVNFFM